MKRVRLENVDIDLKEKLKNEKFKRLYEIECAKVALAQKIAELRQDKHLKQAELAKKMGVSQQFISQIETGEERNLTIETLIKIAKSLGRGVNISFPKLSEQHTTCLIIT
jgi:DNA-binding XRE family transcriptional regulator